MTSGTHPVTSLQPMKTDTKNVGEQERLISALGGGALTLYGLSRRDVGGVLLSLLGGAVLYRGVTGHCSVYQALGINTAESKGQQGIKVQKAVTINKSPEELYRFWRNFENLPRFMTHLESVRVMGDRESHWVAKAPANTTVEWDAEIIEDRENEYIAWRSLPGAQVANAGEVRFVPALGNRGTEVQVSLTYDPPAGALGALVAKLFGEEPNQQIAGDLRRFKNVMEAGEIPTTYGQTSGRVKQVEKQRVSDGGEVTQQTPRKPNQLGSESALTKGIEDTFPASDPVALESSPTSQDNGGTGSNENEVGLGRRIY